MTVYTTGTDKVNGNQAGGRCEVTEEITKRKGTYQKLCVDYRRSLSFLSPLRHNHKYATIIKIGAAIAIPGLSDTKSILDASLKTGWLHRENLNKSEHRMRQTGNKPLRHRNEISEAVDRFV